jgi:hypothetical protein
VAQAPALLPADRGGFVNLQRNKAFWDCRQSPRLYQVFAEIHGTHKLWGGEDQGNWCVRARICTATGPTAISTQTNNNTAPNVLTTSQSCFTRSKLPYCTVSVGGAEHAVGDGGIHHGDGRRGRPSHSVVPCLEPICILRIHEKGVRLTASTASYRRRRRAQLPGRAALGLPRRRTPQRAGHRRSVVLTSFTGLARIARRGPAF